MTESEEKLVEYLTATGDGLVSNACIIAINKMPIFGAYVEAMLWIESSDDCEYCLANVAASTLLAMFQDVTTFFKDNEDLIADNCDDIDHVAHDFALTRNGAGAGFWDGDYDEAVGKALTDASHKFNPYSLYMGDDGKVYGFGG
jgi:hypothetical protein